MMFPEVADVRQLVLRPGDRLVVQFPGPLTAEAAANVMNMVRSWAGPGVPILILDEGAVLEVAGDDWPGEISRAAD